MSLMLFSACKKDKTTTPDPEPITPPAQTDTLKCMDLPKTPQPFGWKDTSANQDRNINAFFYNPLNANEIIFIANGDLFGYNKMYLYNIPTKQATYLSDNGSELPHINNKGWIVFGRSDFNIYKIKTNGDSITQLTSNNINHDAKWDKDGNHIYFFRTAMGAYPSAFIEADKKGTILNETPTEYINTAIAHKSNRIAYLKTFNTNICIYYKDLTASSETLIISGQGSSTTYQAQFSNLTFDISDENLYWSNDKGIFKCNIATSKVDTLLKNCPNIKYDRPFIANNANTMTFSGHFMKPISSTQLLHQYKAFELDLNLRQLHEVRVFP